jgi:predicted DNA-binding protein
MDTQEFLSIITADAFSEETMQKVHAVIGDSTKVTVDMVAQVSEILEHEIDDNLKDVEVDPEVLQALQNEADTQIAQADALANETYEIVQRNLSELIDLSKKVDVLERLHPTG